MPKHTASTPAFALKVNRLGEQIAHMIHKPKHTASTLLMHRKVTDCTKNSFMKNIGACIS